MATTSRTDAVMSSKGHVFQWHLGVSAVKNCFSLLFSSRIGSSFDANSML